MLDLKQIVDEVKILIETFRKSECFKECIFDQVVEEEKRYRLIIYFPNCIGELMINEPEYSPYYFVKFEALADISNNPVLIISWYAKKSDTLRDILSHLTRVFNCAVKY